MIYHVLKEPKMMATPYPGEAGKLAWERKLQNEVCSYLTHIWKSAGSPSNTFIALDGVVPYAKIKQQRFRRFKGGAEPQGASGGAEPQGASGGESGGAWGGAFGTQWDKNAITPGTQFMASMAASLKEAGKAHGWIISDTDEPGEGEHKVLQWLLKGPLVKGPVVVYGLDADLILLCLIAGDKLGPEYPIYLLREAMAFGKLVRTETNVELCFFQISTLSESLQKESKWTREQFYDYIFGMSFCGNDFLPTGLSLRIRDEGHSILLSGLQDLWANELHLVRIESDGPIRPNAEGLLRFAQWISRQEERLIVAMVRRKMMARLGEDEAENLPLREQAERHLVDEVGQGQIVLRNNWESTYAKIALGEDSVDQRKARVQDFWKGWCWILDYYQGLPVDLEWVYPAGYPPTWKDLVSFFELSSEPWETRKPLKPQEQLALVLPMSSWGLMLKTAFRDLPTKVPQMWPQGFHLETFGKRFGWECEPMIPMLTPGRLRYEMLN
jgi:5'-3' exonuclease